MICEECVRLLELWTGASQELSRRTAVLTAIATSGDLVRYCEEEALVEDARLRFDNARTAFQLHRASHGRRGWSDRLSDAGQPSCVLDV